VIARELPARVELRGGDAAALIVIPAPKGRAKGQYPVGKYHVDIFVYDAAFHISLKSRKLWFLRKCPLGAAQSRPRLEREDAPASV